MSQDTPLKDLIKAIGGAVEGKTYLDPIVVGRIVQQAIENDPSAYADTVALTERELAVLQLR